MRADLSVRRAVAMAVSIACSASGAVRADTEVVETAHYRLHVEDHAVRSDECRVILEQAWPVFREFFKAEPEVAAGETLALNVYATKERWYDAAIADRATPPANAGPAWFSSATGAVYVQQHELAYVTRALVLYGACVQFHALAKAKNRDLDAWYVHGIAESLAMHAWDGEHLKLGVSPRICVLDQPAMALDALGGERFGLDVWTVERLQISSVRWCAARFALEGAGGKYRSRFEKLALGYTGSKVSGEDFMRSLGREKSIAEEFHAWLLGAQLPFAVVRGDFEDMFDGRIVARPTTSRIAIACARRSGDSLACEIEPPRDRDTSVAVVLGLVGPSEYTLLRVRPPGAFLEHYSNDQLVRTEPFAFEEWRAARVTLSAHRAERQVSVRVDGRDFGPFEVESPRLGVAVVGGSVAFRDLR